MDKRLELWTRAGELLFSYENILKSPMQNEVKFQEDEIKEFTEVVSTFGEELKVLTEDIIRYMNDNKVTNCDHDYEYSSEIVGIFSQSAKCKKCGKEILEFD